jgi:DNA invertase Pin-like site-specific DNA recombinase
VIPAAQYLRMSTESQQYSLQHQTAAIREYANLHDYKIVQTYSDGAKSGLVIRHRDGLKALLSDVLDRNTEYSAVLVYDVSRWGRFLDTDESATYEFLCRSAGMNVHYCAEPFENDGSLASTLLKTLKRSMAAEFSRELGAKEYAGKKRLSESGFFVGGRTPYGLRRKIISADANRSQILEDGEQKNVREERVKLVRGPLQEVHTICEIFRMVLQKRMTSGEIARDLNRRGVLQRSTRWNGQMITSIVANPVYAGCCVWGRTSQRLGAPRTEVNRDDWSVKPDSFDPIISRAEFDRAQRLLQRDGRKFWTLSRVLESAKKLLKKEKGLNLRMFDRTPGAPSSTTIRGLGGLAGLCKSLGYILPEVETVRASRNRNTMRLKRQLATELAARFPSELSVVPGPRPRLLLDTRIVISLFMCPTVYFSHGKPRWRLLQPRQAALSLICRLDETNAAVQSLTVFPSIRLRGHRRFGEDDPWFKSGNPVDEISQFCEVVRLTASHHPPRPGLTRPSVMV